MAIRFGVSSTVKNRLPRYSNFWDGTAVYSPWNNTGSYDALATYTVPSGGVSSITFAGLPTGGQYTHLQLRATALNGSGWNRFNITLNNQAISSSYNDHYLYGTGAVVAAGYEASTSKLGGSNPTYPGVSVIDFVDYAATNKFKTIRGLTGYDANGSGFVLFGSILWQSTSAINQITITDEASNNFSQYSTFSLYGVKG